MAVVKDDEKMKPCSLIGKIVHIVDRNHMYYGEAGIVKRYDYISGLYIIAMSFDQEVTETFSRNQFKIRRYNDGIYFYRGETITRMFGGWWTDSSLSVYATVNDAREAIRKHLDGTNTREPKAIGYAYLDGDNIWRLEKYQE